MGQSEKRIRDFSDEEIDSMEKPALEFLMRRVMSRLFVLLDPVSYRKEAGTLIKQSRSIAQIREYLKQAVRLIQEKLQFRPVVIT